MHPEYVKANVKTLAGSLHCNNKLFQFARFMDDLNDCEIPDIVYKILDYSKNEEFFNENYLEFKKVVSTESFHYEFKKTFESLTTFMQDSASAANYADIMAHILKYFERSHMKHILTTMLHDDLSEAHHLDIRDIILGHFHPKRYSPLPTYIQNILPIHSMINGHEVSSFNWIEHTVDDVEKKFYKDVIFVSYQYNEYDEYPKVVAVSRKSRFTYAWIECAKYYENFNDKMVAIE